MLFLSIGFVALITRVSSKELQQKSFILRDGRAQDGMVVKYDVGYIRGPGSVDFGSLTFHSETENKLDSAVDIAIIPIPNAKCLYQETFKDTEDGHECDWDQLGIGVRKGSNHDSVEFCCTEEAFQNGWCNEKDYGRLIVADHIQRQSVQIPKFASRVPYQTVAPDNRIVNVAESGLYGIVYAFCGEGLQPSLPSEQIQEIPRKTQTIEMTGKAVWKSKHGYLPGELYGFMNFYTCIASAYLILALWLWYNICGKDHNYWIMSAVVAGTVEMLCRTAEFYFWNSTGYRSIYAVWFGIILCVFKEGLTRCVALLVLLDSDHKTIKSWNLQSITIYLCLYIYISTRIVANILTLVAVDFADRLTFIQLNFLITAIEIFGPYLKIFLDVCFTVLALYSLYNKSILTVNANNKGYQNSQKLQRFGNLRILYSIVVILVTAFYILSRFDHYTGGIIAVEHAWAKEAACEVFYLILLVGISMICWKHNTNDSDESSEISLRVTLLPIYELVGDVSDEHDCMNVSERGIQIS